MHDNYPHLYLIFHSKPINLNRHDESIWIDSLYALIFPLILVQLIFFPSKTKKKRKKETKIGYQLIGRNPCNERRILITFCFVWQWSCRHNVIVIIIVQRRMGGEGVNGQNRVHRYAVYASYFIVATRNRCLRPRQPWKRLWLTRFKPRTGWKGFEARILTNE